MNITTHYDIGSVVIVNVDGSYQKGKIEEIHVIMRSNSLLPIVNYRVNAKYKAVINTDKNKNPIYCTVERNLICNEQELETSFALYKETEGNLTTKEHKYPQAKRDHLILWNMSNPTKQGEANANAISGI